jgi:hypothetical protein
VDIPPRGQISPLGARGEVNNGPQSAFFKMEENILAPGLKSVPISLYLIGTCKREQKSNTEREIEGER